MGRDEASAPNRWGPALTLIGAAVWIVSEFLPWFDYAVPAIRFEDPTNMGLPRWLYLISVILGLTVPVVAGVVAVAQLAGSRQRLLPGVVIGLGTVTFASTVDTFIQGLTGQIAFAGSMTPWVGLGLAGAGLIVLGGLVSAFARGSSASK